jgi:L-asparaginase
MQSPLSATVVVLGTGGTISGSAASPDDNLGYVAGTVGVDALVAAAGPSGVAVETEQIAQLDSKDMDFATWQRLAQRVAHHAARPEVAGVVVTHGTDTLEETAYSWPASSPPSPSRWC